MYTYTFEIIVYTYQYVYIIYTYTLFEHYVYLQRLPLTVENGEKISLSGCTWCGGPAGACDPRGGSGSGWPRCSLYWLDRATPPKSRGWCVTGCCSVHYIFAVNVLAVYLRVAVDELSAWSAVISVLFKVELQPRDGSPRWLWLKSRGWKNMNHKHEPYGSKHLREWDWGYHLLWFII